MSLTDIVAIKDMHSAAERGDWDSAVNHAQKVRNLVENPFRELPQHVIPPEKLDHVVSSVPGYHMEDFLYELCQNMHPGYSHDQLMNLWSKSEYSRDVDRAITAHPNWSPTDQQKKDIAASEFWRGYEEKTTAHHFAAIKSLFSGKDETVTDHRRRVGTSNVHKETIPHLKGYAQKVQEAVLKDPDIKKKYFNGKPYVKLYRGVGGNYGAKISEAAGLDRDTHSVEDRTLNIPVANLTSWTTSPEMANQFAVGRGDIPKQQKDRGVVISAWHPVDSILHSGYHTVYPGQKHAHPSEEEIVVGHATNKVKAKTKHMLFQRSYQEPLADGTRVAGMVKPSVRPKPFRKSDIFDFIGSHESLFKNLVELDLSDIEMYEDEDGLIKAFKEPRNIGEMHPMDPTLVARQHPISKKISWHTVPAMARRTDQEILDQSQPFLEKLSPEHRRIMSRAINDVATSSTRHFRIGWDKDPRKQVLRARHIKSLLRGQEGAKLDVSDPSKVVLTMDRHRGIPGETTRWVLTEQGGHDNGDTLSEFLRRNQERVQAGGAGFSDQIHGRERSLGDVPGRVRSPDAELRGSGYSQDQRGVHGSSGPSQYPDLVKSPVDTDPSEVKRLGEEGSYTFNQKHDSYVTSNPLKGGLFHHVFQDKKDPSSFVHVISNSSNHKDPTLATVEGKVDGKALNVTRAYVDPEHIGKDHGKLAYAAALMHHGALRSDNQTSVGANRAWRHMKENIPGVSVRLGSGNYSDRHSAVVRGDGSDLKAHLGVKPKELPPMDFSSAPGGEDESLTVMGKRVDPNPGIKFTTKSSFDSQNGVLHTPKGSFSLSMPHHEDQDYKKILDSSDIQDLHSGAMKNWFKLNDIIRSGGKLPDEIVAHANLFSILSANTPVPQQELLYSRLVDTMKEKGLDPRSSQFGEAFSSGGEGRRAWKQSDSPVDLPAHARQYWGGRARPAVTQLEPSETTGRQPGDITALGAVDSFSDRISKYPQVHKYINDLVAQHGGNTQAVVSQMMADKKNPKLPDDHPMKLGVGLGSKTARYAMSMLGGGQSVIPDTHFVRHVFGLDAKTDGNTIDYLKKVLWEEKNHHLLNQLDDYYHKNHPAVKYVTDRYFNGKDNPHSNFPAFWLHWLSIAPHEKAQGIGKPYASKNLTDHTPFFDSANEILQRHGLDKVLKKSGDRSLRERAAAAMHEMHTKLGPEFSSMVYYGHIVPMLIGSGQSMNKSDDQQKTRLVHYSHIPDLTRLDPKFYGTGHRGAEHRRSPGPRTFYYLEGTKPEDVVTQRAPHRYVAELPENHKIYDVGSDPHGVVARAVDQAKGRAVNPGMLTPEDVEEAVKAAGYQGMYNSSHPNIPNAVTYFHPLDVKREEETGMSKSFFEDLEKVGEGYKKLMASGIALLHPVKIGNKTVSDDGIPFHTTIKVFHPQEDRFQQAHDVARSLNMLPPDPSKTTVKPMIFKDRFGDDVHVLELGGDAERVVDSNAAFQGMGFPAKYKFRPHITIDQGMYDRAVQQGPKTAADMGITFGDAELRSGHEVVRKYPANQAKGQIDGDN